MRFRFCSATVDDRPAIYRLRHQVYAEELGQHAVNNEGTLTDKLDGFNHYILAWCGDELVGCVSITPPAGESYSIDKYFLRDQLPFEINRTVY